MGCTSAKQIKKNTKTGSETVVADIIQVIDQLDLIKEKYIYSNQQEQMFNKKNISIEDFLLQSYRTNRFSKEELSEIYYQIRGVFIKVDNLLQVVKKELAEQQSQQSKQNKKDQLKADVEEVYTDFLNIFTDMSKRILDMPPIQFDSYNYELKKCITSANSQSVVWDSKTNSQLTQSN